MRLCQICNEKFGRHKHHIQSRSLGGSNDKQNICSLCPNCHDSVHRAEIILEGNFLTSNGYTLIYHKSGEESITGQEPKCFIFGKTA